LASPITFRPLSQLVRQVVPADHISNGRVELGIDVGWIAGEHEQNGFPFPALAKRHGTIEGKALITRLQAVL
jgi:alkanesulfonate monooxygenase SsuD/methylene tetrahydromethanopterin reductase-like flavin-dependent oxidoreductase (luciferase family)